MNYVNLKKVHSSMIHNDYYVYVYTDPTKPGKWEYGEYTFNYKPFYVGKGRKARYKSHLKNSVLNAGFNHAKEHRIRTLIEAGYDLTYYIVFISTGLDELGAFELEEAAIERMGRKFNSTGILYNLESGGGGDCLREYANKTKGKTYEEIYGAEKASELKNIRRERLLGRNNPMYGKSSHNKGLNLSEEQKEQMSIARRKEICQVDKAGKVVAIFESAKHASDTTGIGMSGIHNVLGNTRARTAGGFYWGYTENIRRENDGSVPAKVYLAIMKDPEPKTLEFEGKLYTFNEAAAVFGVCYNTLKNRLRLGWSIERTLLEPIGKNGNKTLKRRRK